MRRWDREARDSWKTFQYYVRVDWGHMGIGDVAKQHGFSRIHYADLETLSVGGSAIHEMGTARMGDDPGESVLNKYNQAHELGNLFVTDGAFMTSASCVNPSLTYMAFTARACDYAAEQLRTARTA